MQISGLELQVEWTQGPDRLFAHYRLTNKSGLRLFVFDQNFATLPHGGRLLEADRAYVWLQADGTLFLDKLTPALPEDREVESPEVPYARLLEPGTVAEGWVRLSVPVLTTPPYDPPATAPGARAKRAVFRIGVAKTEVDAPAKEIRGLEGAVWSLPHRWVAPRQVVLQAEPLEIDLPLASPMPKK